MKLLGGIKSKTTKDENVPCLETTEVVLIIILLTAIISKIQEPCISLFLISHLVNC